MATQTKPKSELDAYFPRDDQQEDINEYEDSVGESAEFSEENTISDLDAQFEVFENEISAAFDRLLPGSTVGKRKAILKTACSTAELNVLFEKESAEFWIEKIAAFIAKTEKKSQPTKPPAESPAKSDVPLPKSESENPDLLKAFGVAIANAALKRTGNKETIKAFVKAACGSDVLPDLYNQNSEPRFWIAKIFGYRDPVAEKALGKRAKNTVKVKGGAEYYKAAGRIHDFREKYPDSRASITTELIRLEPDIAVFKALIIVDNQVVSTAHAMCTPLMAEKAQGRYMEMAETNAVARALGYFDYGTGLLDKDDGPVYMADSPQTPSK